MAKKCYLGIDNNDYYLEEFGKDENGVHYKKRTNSIRKIEAYLKQEGKGFIDGQIKENNLILYTVKHTCFIIENYQELDYELFPTFFTRVQTAPIVSNNLKKGIRSNPLELFGLKFLYMNRFKLATIAMTGVLTIAGSTFLANGTSNLMKIQDIELIAPPEIVTEETLSEKPVLSIDTMDNRLRETSYLQTKYGEYDRNRIMIGARVNQNRMQELFASDHGKIIMETAKTYGVDPYLLAAKGLTESNLDHEACCPNGKNYNGYGVGAFQLESPDGRTVKAWNFEKNCEDTLSITMENATDFTKNTQAAAMYLQNRLFLYHNNIYLALQSYNYGEYMMNLVIHDYAKAKGITEEEVIQNTNDLGWLEIVQDIHENPNDYYYRVMLDPDETNQDTIEKAKRNYIWKHKTYGNDCYVADVLSYYVGLQSKNRNLDGTNTVIDLSNFDHLLVPENSAKMM